MSSKKSNQSLILTAVIICAAVAALILGSSLGKPSENSQNSESDDNTQAVVLPENSEIDETGTQVITAGEYLTIPISEISSTASFYSFEIDGIQMEVFAIKASDGTIRTAFNTCQSCYGSGAAYYVQNGNDLICQNCKSHFSADQVEIQSGGCNPWPIFPENKIVTEDSILISYEFLHNYAYIFKNWKSS